MSPAEILEDIITKLRRNVIADLRLTRVGFILFRMAEISTFCGAASAISSTVSCTELNEILGWESRQISMSEKLILFKRHTTYPLLQTFPHVHLQHSPG